MGEHEAVICPFCGAPYAGEVPHDVVHVKCKYCGGVVLLPSHLSVVPRCPNHPDTIAVGLCSRCFQGFCKECLHLLRLEGGQTYLCTTCMETRRTDGALVLIGGGLIMLFIAFLAGAAESSFLLTVVFALVFSLPFLIYGLYVLKRPLHSFAPTVQKIQQAREARIKAKIKEKDEGVMSDEAEYLYWKIWGHYVRTIGVSGPSILERRIRAYTDHGLTLNEAVARIAKEDRMHLR